MAEITSPPPRVFRSGASNNWRIKDDSPRADQAQVRSRVNRNDGQSPHTNLASNTQPRSDAAPGTRLYVGNLLYSVQKADIEALFAEQGFNVVGVTISTDPFTGRNPSYCFVDLGSAEEAQRAIADLNGVDVRGRALRVKPGVARRGQTSDQPQGENGTAREVRVKNFEQGWGRETKEERSTDYKPTFDRWNRSDASSHWQAPQTEGRRLFVGSLPRIEPQSALDEEIQTLFATYLPDEGITPTAVSKLISPHPSKVAGGEPGDYYYCFVDLARAEDVETVIEKLAGAQGSWGGNLRVGRAREQRERGGPERKVLREQGLRNEGEKKPFDASRWRKDGAQE
ncbi:hypothetical protein A1O3_08373 [Capronia epimyces CBS 606.96]|uniref:RRM domain-containing protein n=1 Tax=Capronia epimyces CBS 606.96 TaxID=1182542 RepID=W9XHT7_9EURO|nr:uncharacterized protein A1O3_08373 [Capronia epimyces CBS 606.96]EXJ80087.1 hypothetical protein A1O3_08373 [Capronia epimyces CBS 606.96]